MDVLDDNMNDSQIVPMSRRDAICLFTKIIEAAEDDCGTTASTLTGTCFFELSDVLSNANVSTKFFMSNKT